MNITLCVTIFFNFFHIFFSNEMDRQKLDMETHNYTYIGTEVAVKKKVANRSTVLNPNIFSN